METLGYEGPLAGWHGKRKTCIGIRMRSGLHIGMDACFPLDLSMHSYQRK